MNQNKSLNKAGWKSVKDVYPPLKLIKGAKLPLILLAISSVAYYFSESADPLSILDRLTGFVISGFPSIIGFILTGYTLIIGLSGTDITSVFKKIPNGQNYSYFMIVSSIFAVVLGFVVLTYILACLISYIQCLQIVWPWHQISVYWFNVFCLFAFMFIFFYSICALLDVIVNVFNLSLVINKTIQESKMNNED